jgi:hypothetical protein
MTTQGNWARTFINGYEVTANLTQSSYQHVLKANPTMAQNTGVHAFSPGLFQPRYSLSNTYRAHGIGGINLHNLLDPLTDNGNDTELIVSEIRGNNATPARGDIGLTGSFTLQNYDMKQSASGAQLMADTTFMPRGKWHPAFPRLIYIQDTGTAAVTGTGTDMGASAVGLTYGGVATLQVFTPSGVQATGTITVSSTPADGDTVVVGGTTYTFKTSLTPTAGQVLIGGSASAAAVNLFKALTSGDGAGTNYASGTTVGPSTCFYSVPSSSNVITVTYKTTGTGGNAFTLAKTGTAVAVSGATLSGGSAGTAVTFKLQTATSSGGSYTDRATFTLDGTVRGAERQEVAIGTTLDRWARVTTSGVSGTALGFCVMWGVRYNI